MKKINIGVILTIIVIFIYIVLMLLMKNGQEVDKENVQKVLNGYMQVYNYYSLLDKEDRVLDKEIDEVKYNEYLKEMKVNLSKYVEDECLDNIYEQYKERLDKQVLGAYMFYEYVKEIDSIVDYKIVEDCITILVRFKQTVDRDKRISLVYDERLGRYIGDIKKQKGQDYIIELLAFRKIDNNYKLINHGIIDAYSYGFESNVM